MGILGWHEQGHPMSEDHCLVVEEDGINLEYFLVWCQRLHCKESALILDQHQLYDPALVEDFYSPPPAAEHITQPVKFEINKRNIPFADVKRSCKHMYIQTLI